MKRFRQISFYHFMAHSRRIYSTDYVANAIDGHFAKTQELEPFKQQTFTAENNEVILGQYSAY